MFKPFYVHINRGTGAIPKGQHRGATIIVSPMEHDGRSCVVQGAICSRNDAFCRQTGRMTAAKKDKAVVPIRKLDAVIAEIESGIHGYKTKIPASKYEYLYRFMV